MHYNVERRQPFGVRWQPALPKPGEGGSAAATRLLLAKTFGVGWSGATGHPRTVVVYPMDSYGLLRVRAK